MNVIKTKFEDLLVFEPKIWGDERGYFFESYNRNTLQEFNVNNEWIQDNEAYSERGVLRGLHYQKAPFGQAKLVRVAHGEVLDVVVDLRQKSKTYGQSFSIILSGTNKKQMLVPRGFAHGYAVISPKALFLYKVDNVYSAENEFGIRYDDATLNIDWILPKEEILLSEKDKMNESFENHIPYE